MRTIVTGASRGIGLELVRQLAARGDEVVAAARAPEQAHELARIAAGAAGRVRLLPLDVTSDDSVTAFARALAEEGDEGAVIDMLINNAGVMGKRQAFEELDLDDVKRTLESNTLGPIRVTKAVLPFLLRGQGNRVVHISSGLGSIAENTSGGDYGYRISKAALNMANKSLGNDLRGRGFCCVVLSPGWVQTDMGGSSAPTSVADSVRGMLEKIDALRPHDTGRFIDFRGADLPY